MSLIDFIAAYGYAAVLAGTLLEGEMILLLAGWAAHQGHLSLPLVMLVAFVGGTVGDQAFFWIGRHWGRRLLRRWPAARARALYVGKLLRRHDASLVFGIRFMYGLRIAGPIAMGALRLRARRFAIFNALGAAVWAVVVGGLGYVLGHTLEMLLGDLQRYENAVAWTLVAGVGLMIMLHRLFHALRLRGARPPGGSRTPRVP
ncbi:DedA family protein [Ramlibacter sp. G-1-2-2]|uniref:DedA family protein n=1 Tax=Ramlibacter agri TaxID=2728837 RepID=A0A848H7V1_9BURK|nr:DedA family protein [Ramlibacter agri]NML45440.1 DedA family protein [Ramlibacter agri]